MNELNLVKLLKLFSKKDLTEFDKFLRSPLFNNQSTLVRLFREIKKYHPGFDHKKLNNELLFQAVNPDKPFNSLVFRKYISSITKLAEEYLYFSGASEDKYRKDLTLLEIYQRAGLDNLYAKKEK